MHEPHDPGEGTNFDRCCMFSAGRVRKHSRRPRAGQRPEYSACRRAKKTRARVAETPIRYRVRCGGPEGRTSTCSRPHQRTVTTGSIRTCARERDRGEKWSTQYDQDRRWTTLSVEGNTPSRPRSHHDSSLTPNILHVTAVQDGRRITSIGALGPSPRCKDAGARTPPKHCQSLQTRDPQTSELAGPESGADESRFIFHDRLAARPDRETDCSRDCEARLYARQYIQCIHVPYGAAYGTVRGLEILR